MADNINFRSAMRGYHKDDVNRFILDSDRLHREEAAELQEKIRSISEERDSLRENLNNTQQSHSQLESSLDEKINALIVAEKRIKELETAISDIEAKCIEEAKVFENSMLELESIIQENEKQLSKQTDVLKEKETENNRLNASLSAAMADCQNQNKQALLLQEEVKATKEALYKTNEELKNLSEKYASLESNYSESANALEILTKENEQLKQSIAEAKEGTTSEEENDYGQLMIEFEALKSEFINLEMENETLRAQASIIPQATTNDDGLQSRLGEVILQANRTAEQIIREANNTAKLIKMGAVEESTVIKKNFEDKMQQRAERAERLLGELCNKYFQAFETTKAEVADQISSMLSEKKNELNQITQALQKETEDSLLLTDAQAAALLK